VLSSQAKAEKAAKKGRGLQNAGISKSPIGKKKVKGGRLQGAGKKKGDQGHAIGEAWERGGKLFTPGGKVFPVNDVVSFATHMVSNYGVQSIPKGVRKQAGVAVAPAPRRANGGGKGARHPAAGLRNAGVQKKSPARKGRGQIQAVVQKKKSGKGGKGGKGKKSPKAADKPKIGTMARLSMSLDQC